jgi:hypothetical protein
VVLLDVMHGSTALRQRTTLAFIDRQSISRRCTAVIGFLDTFDLFDSSRAALPGNFLRLPLLSFVSVLVCDLPLEKMQSRD